MTGYPMFQETDWKIDNLEYAFHPIRILTLVKKVSPDNPSLNNPACADWQLLGELELPVGSRIEGWINVWLMEILHPLNLHDDFFNRILKSVHALQIETITDLKAVHLLVYSQMNPSKGQTWGFFRIEKAGVGRYSQHSIEFYLYLEGP